MNKNIESHLDKVFAEAAQNLSKKLSGKIWNYKIDDSLSFDSKGLKVAGRCIVENVIYDSLNDYNVYIITDVDTGKRYLVNQFIIDITE